jgi:hypothetical protein
MEEIQTFTVNPSFLQEYWPQNYDDFWFEYEKDEEWNLKKVRFNWKKLPDALWQAIFSMRWELIKAHRKERDQYKKKIKAVEERETYKAEVQRMMTRNHRQKMDNKYQTDTCRLYRKILERFVNLPCDDE